MTTLVRKYSFDEVMDSQRVYRLVLYAMSNPTKAVNIREYGERLYGGHPALLALAFTLLDNEVTFCVCGDEELAGEIACLTLSKQVPPDSADYLFVTEPSRLESVIQSARCGTLRDPHQSATILVCNEGEKSRRLRFIGPGIKDIVERSTTDTVRLALELRDRQAYERPQGVDILFVSENGELVAIPRLITGEVV